MVSLVPSRTRMARSSSPRRMVLITPPPPSRSLVESAFLSSSPSRSWLPPLPPAVTRSPPGFQMGGKFTVPSYRTGLFLDPKGRGMSTGYDMAVALPGKQSGVEGDAELFKENNKVFDVLGGQIEFEVNRVNAEEGEIGGVFVSTQASDTDMGGKEPQTILLKGIFYGRIE
ncbi:unnamed protein product [Heterosigma akashiwo]